MRAAASAQESHYIILVWVMAYLLLQGTTQHICSNATNTIDTINQHAVMSSGQVAVDKHDTV